MYLAMPSPFIENRYIVLLSLILVLDKKRKHFVIHKLLFLQSTTKLTGGFEAQPKGHRLHGLVQVSRSAAGVVPVDALTDPRLFKSHSSCQSPIMPLRIHSVSVDRGTGGPGSDQATLLTIKGYHPKSRCSQALNLHFHTPKCPSKVPLHAQLNG